MGAQKRYPLDVNFAFLGGIGKLSSMMDGLLAGVP